MSDRQSLEELQSLARQFLMEKIAPHKRMALLRGEAIDRELTIRDPELMAIFAAARKDLQGKSDGEELGAVLHIPKENWAVDQLIAARTFNLVVALQKVGKSAFVSGLLGVWKSGFPDFLGFNFKGDCPPIIIAGTDQPLGDWREILVGGGLMQEVNADHYELVYPVVKLWHRGNPIHLDEEGIELITEQANKYRGSIVFADSFGALTSPLGIDEWHPAAAEPVHNLCESLEGTDATLILLHHSSKSRSGERASNSARGSNSITAAASQIIQLDWLKKDKKTDQRITLNTEGRNSRPVDLVVEQVDRSSWISHGSSEDIEKESKLEEVEAKLNDRQSIVLSILRDKWDNGQQEVDAVQIVELIGDDLGKSARTKALHSLDQLTGKELALKRKTSDPERGTVALFRPIEAGDLF